MTRAMVREIRAADDALGGLLVRPFGDETVALAGAAAADAVAPLEAALR
jgi:hypothetical protein